MAPEKNKKVEEAETKAETKKVVKKTTKTATKKKAATPGIGTYIYGRGRRKSAIARVRVVKNGKGVIQVNGRPIEEYFPTVELQGIVRDPLKISGQETAVDVIIKVEGGGIHGQAEAVRLGISRALIELNPTFRTVLKKLGFLSRDARVKERKKFGLKKARRAPQWSKR